MPASYLACYLCIGNGKLDAKRDDFNFPIINFQFLSSNIHSAPAFGVYVSQLVHSARACLLKTEVFVVNVTP